MLRVSRDVSDIADERTGGTGARFWRRTTDGPDSFEPSRPPRPPKESTSPLYLGRNRTPSRSPALSRACTVYVCSLRNLVEHVRARMNYVFEWRGREEGVEPFPYRALFA